MATVFLHGGPLVYGSQEVGYEQPINFFHYVAVDWTAKPEIRNEYKQLIALLKANPALLKGTYRALPDNDILAFVKSGAGQAESFLVLVNLRNAEHEIALPEFAGKKVTDMMTGSEDDLDQKVDLQPYEYKILKL